MLRTTLKRKNQNKPYQGNCQRNSYQNSLVHLGLLSYKKINNNQNKTACQTSNRKKSNPVVFYHDLTPLVKNNPPLRKATTKLIPQTKETANSASVFGRETKRFTTPATNQATPMLERNSAISFFWPADNFFIKNNDSKKQAVVNYHYFLGWLVGKRQLASSARGFFAKSQIKKNKGNHQQGGSNLGGIQNFNNHFSNNSSILTDISKQSIADAKYRVNTKNSWEEGTKFGVIKIAANQAAEKLRKRPASDLSQGLLKNILIKQSLTRENFYVNGNN